MAPSPSLWIWPRGWGPRGLTEAQGEAPCGPLPFFIYGPGYWGPRGLRGLREGGRTPPSHNY